jgi:hypothetical protein
MHQRTGMKRPHLVLLAGALLAVASCQSSSWSAAPSASVGATAAAAPGPIALAEGTIATFPRGPVAWVADEVTIDERPVKHSHEAAFVYAAVSPSRLTLPSGTRTLAPGQAVFVPAGVPHTHDRTCVVPTDCHDSFWEVRLADPGARPPAGDMQTTRVFVSPIVSGPADGPVHARLDFLGEVPVSAPVTNDEYVYARRGSPALAWRIAR